MSAGTGTELIAGKVCAACLVEKALGDFYRSARQIHSYCKECHNKKCVERRMGDEGYRHRQYQAKRAWTRCNPVRKAMHERRTIVLHQGSAVPASLRCLERLVLQLSARAIEQLPVQELVRQQEVAR